jgi:hypothetical protein
MADVPAQRYPHFPAWGHNNRIDVPTLLVKKAVNERSSPTKFGKALRF